MYKVIKGRKKGQTGIKGETGIKGQTGIKGETGIQGVTGIKGQIGIKGLTGVDGVKGDIGPKGVPGAAGTGLTNCGNWVSGTTYAPGCYVFYATSGSDSTIAMWILEGTEPYTSITFPYNDPEHWILFQAPSGQDGAKGQQGIQG